MSEASIYARVEELFDRYLSEGSVEKLFALYYALSCAESTAREKFSWKFGSIRPLTQVIEELRGIGVQGYSYELGRLVGDLMSTKAARLIMEDAMELCRGVDEAVKKALAILALILERNGSLPQYLGVDALRLLYVTLIGEAIDEDYWVNHVVRALCRMHLIDHIFDRSISWTPWATSVLKELELKWPSPT